MERAVHSIGIPRALGYYLYPKLWETFFSELGIKVVLSPPTSRRIIEQAGLISEAEHCLPFKLFDAHVAELVGKVDMIFVPRILSMRKKHLSCPKLSVLPDNTRAQYGDAVRVLSTDIDVRKTPLTESMAHLGRLLNVDQARVRTATECALNVMKREAGMTISLNETAPLRFLVISHPYNLYDPYLSDMILNTLAAQGVGVDTLSFDRQDMEPKPLVWDMCSVMYDGLRLLDAKTCAGVVEMSSFNCGCDSVAGYLFRELLNEKRIPCMTLVLDEHAGQAGIETRLEAFVDSIKEQRDAITRH
jgi:predicted nucleotide-binding protein (sugar kinase/HSP70/actin superfamily)